MKSKTKKPFFSIIIPTFNRSKELQFALFCIFQQNFSDFEIVISDNCSTDDTKEVVKIFNSKKITYLRNKKNIVYSLNTKNALKHAKGRYIFLHSDDDFLFDKNSLRNLYGKIKKYNPGYIRAMYLCVSQDRKRIFNFRLNNPFLKNKYLPPSSNNNDVLSFILNSDHYFITGTIFKNSFPKNITMLTSEHAPWMEILLYIVKKYGGYFDSTIYIAAVWSTWRNRSDGLHPVYNLINGKLEAENYFNIVKKNIGKSEYEEFLHTQLMGMYVRLFPLIKVLGGNKNLLNFSKRIRIIDSRMERNVRYWTYLYLSLFLPKIAIKIVKNLFLYYYMKKLEVKNKQVIISRLEKIEMLYRGSKYFRKNESVLFKF